MFCTRWSNQRERSNFNSKLLRSLHAILKTNFGIEVIVLVLGLFVFVVGFFTLKAKYTCGFLNRSIVLVLYKCRCIQ